MRGPVREEAHALVDARPPVGRHAARSPGGHPDLLDRRVLDRRNAGRGDQGGDAIEGARRRRLPRGTDRVADLDRRRQCRVLCLSRQRDATVSAHQLGRGSEQPLAEFRNRAADHHDHQPDGGRGDGDGRGALAAARGTVPRPAAQQLHRRRLHLQGLVMRAPHRLRGFSMVELMVAMMIALIAVIIMFQVFETSDGVRRKTASGGEAQQKGTIALYTLQRDLRNAGMGINDTSYAGCPLKGYDSARTTPAFPPVGVTMVLSPALITPGANAQTPDQLAVFYGSKGQIGNSTTLTANMVDATSPLQVFSRFGFRPGDLVLMLEPGSGKDCIFVEITS